MFAVEFYDVALWGRISAILIAFGVTFAYPVVIPYFLRQAPRSAPAWFALSDRIGKLVIMPFATLALLIGAYLASDRDLWGEVWVVVPLVILVVLLALGGAFFAPTERKLAELTARDVTAAGDGEVVWSKEVDALGRRAAVVGSLSSLLVLIAAYFMTAKPFA